MMSPGPVAVDPVLQRLDDENEICKLVAAFSLGMDTRDLDLFRSSWADEVDLDLPPLAGRAIQLSGRLRADDYARSAIALVCEFETTQHVNTNHLVTVSGDQGTCICYTVAQHYLPVGSGDPWLTVGARYDLSARRFAEAGWRFVGFKLTHLWSRGNTSLWKEVARRLSANHTP